MFRILRENINRNQAAGENEIRFITARRAENWMVKEYEKTEKDYKYLETSPEAQAAGLRRITRPKFIDKIPKNVSLRDCKSRIAIYLDADIIEHFKQEAASSGEGYQTLINRALRSAVESENALPEQIKENLLSDKEFLQSLKSALAI